MTYENLRSTENVPSVKKRIVIYICFHYLTPLVIIYVNLYRFNVAVINVYADLSIFSTLSYNGWTK